LTLRGGASTRVLLDHPPEAATSPVDTDLVDRIGAGAALEIVHRVEVLAEAWSNRAPAALRAGGLGVRDLRAVAALLRIETGAAALLVEVAAAAGLVAIGMTDELDAAWLPTDRPLSVRIWEAGDAMVSNGATPRKVKHFLSDAGVTGHERTAWPVVLAGDQIIWIPGVRRSDGVTA